MMRNTLLVCLLLCAPQLGARQQAATPQSAASTAAAPQTATSHGTTSHGTTAHGTTAQSAIKLGTYRAVLMTPGGELPFGLVLAEEGGATVGYLLNGKERLPLQEVSINGSHLQIDMPGYENHLTADAVGDELTGQVVLDKLGGKQQHVPLRARLGETYRFFPSASPSSADVAGRWSVTFRDADGSTEPAVGEFAQTHDQVTGTFLTATGDHRYLAGQVEGDELSLSTFDGAHVYLYKAKLKADGTLAGDYWSGTAYHEEWQGNRDARAALPDAYSLTNLRKGSTQFDFAFPDLDGHTVSSSDPQFKGKVVIVALAGSWCPNCHDEAAFLEPLYKDYRARGLEVVSLMFEHFGDFPQAAAATLRFRKHYGIEYATLIAGVSDKDDAAKRLPMLDKVYAFPTTIFIDRKGKVRKIHTGFSGPATGEHYTQFVGEVKATLDQLLAESS